MKAEFQQSERDLTSFSIILQVGSEYGPDCPTGRDDLHIDLSGQVRFENHRNGSSWTKHARLTPDCLQAWRRAIRECDFGQVPNPHVQPGAYMVSLTLQGATGHNTVRFDRRNAQNWPGYGWMLKTALSWWATLRHNTQDSLAPEEGLIL